MWRPLATAAAGVWLALSLSACDLRGWFVCSLGFCGNTWDTVAPPAPDGLHAAAGDASVRLWWPELEEGSPARYRLYRDGAVIKVLRLEPQVQAYTDLGLTNGTTYSYFLTAVDAAGNESPPSNTVSVAPNAALPPAPRAFPAPARVTASTAGDGITLRWESVPDAEIYHVYRATNRGGPYEHVSSSGQRQWVDVDVAAPQRYFYVVTASRADRHHESTYSAEASAPAPFGGGPGGFVGAWGGYGIGDGQFRGPSAIAVDASGFVYVAEPGRVQKFTSSGEFVMKWGSLGDGPGQFSTIRGLATDAAGNVYVADTGRHRIQKFTSAGEWLATWGAFGSGPAQFSGPSGLAIDSDGNLYVADTGNSRVQKLGPSGDFLGAWTGDAGTQLRAPAGVAVDSSGSGEVYVTDVSTHRVVRFSAAGLVLGSWGGRGSEAGQFNAPYGIAVDATPWSSGSSSLRTRILVADTANGRLQAMRTGPAPIQMLSGSGTADGRFGAPSAVAHDCRMHLFVADSARHRVFVFGDSDAAPASCTQSRTARIALARRGSFHATLLTTASVPGQRRSGFSDLGARQSGTFTAGLPRSRATARRRLRGTWRAVFDVAPGPMLVTGRARGVALATFAGRRPGRLCLGFDLRYAASARNGIKLTGKFRTLGGTGTARGLNIRGTYTQYAGRSRSWTLTGQARPGAARPRSGLPAQCRR